MGNFRVTEPRQQGIIARMRSALSNVVTARHEDVLQNRLRIEVLPPSRTQKDIATLLQAIKAAESRVNPKRQELYNIYQECLEYDSHLMTVVNKRKSSLLSKAFDYVDNSGKSVDRITEWMEAPQMRAFISDCLDTRFWGHSLFEFIPGDWFNYSLIPRKNVDPVGGYVLKRETDVSGESYRSDAYKPFVMEVGGKYDFGLFLTSSRYCIYKRNMIGDWANYSELAGNNFEKITYQGDDEDVKRAIDDMMKNKGAGTRMRLPRDVDYDIKSSSSASTNDLFEGFHDALNKEISKLFLAQTMTTEGGQSRSQAEIHQEEQGTIYHDDLTYILNLLNYEFTEYLPLWNIPEGRFVVKTPDSLKEQEEISRLEGVARLRGTYSDEYLVEKFKLPTNIFRTNA